SRRRTSSSSSSRTGSTTRPPGGGVTSIPAAGPASYRMYGPFHDHRAAHGTGSVLSASRIFRLHPYDRGGRPPVRKTRRACGDEIPAGTERLSAHRPREVDLPELRRRRRER